MTDDQIEQRRRFISDAFHTLNQPLTGLHCGLEIALQKPRSEQEYRQRIGDGIENASTILSLVRAVRQLVESADPGERFGTLGLSMLLSQMKSELELVAETTRVGVAIANADGVKVAGDPTKLLAALGGLTAGEMGTYDPGSQVKVAIECNCKHVILRMDGEGARRPESGEGAQSLPEKLAQIRRDAALSYLWTIGGDFEITEAGLKIELPLAET